MTANSFTSVSLDPAAGAVLRRQDGAPRAPHPRRDRLFREHPRRHEQQHLSTYFAGGWKESPPPFTFSPWEGGPRLDGSLAALGCGVETIHEGGDHWIVIGRVLSLYRSETADAAGVFRGRYGTLGEPETVV